MNLKQYFGQPFPKAENKWKLILSISFFVALFLIIFQPFGINLYKENDKIIILSGYGLITLCVLIIDVIIIEDIFTKFFDERNWRIWKEFVWLLWIIFSIGLGNAIYTSIVFDFYFKMTFSFIVQFQLITLAIGIIPITILTLTKQKYLYRKYSIYADDLNKTIDKKITSVQKNSIQIIAENEKDIVEFDLDNLLFIESSGNYIEIFLTENGEIKRKTLRSSLKRTLTFFKHSSEIIQCHRAFIVNTNKIKHAKGNSQGLKLSFEDCKNEIPVSRGFVKFVKEIIN